MNKKILMIPIIMIITVFVINFSFDSSEIENDILFHVTLADPDLYTNGVYIDKFTINKGEYFFRFVPNGSSPEILSITLDGKNFDFSENFKLEGTSHQTGVSEYFTWDYNGQKIISISDTQEISITINPNGNIMGSVTVDILEN
ncbi:MAG: hypothetical protein OEQ94_06490 [Nitrosopumilus sp.]|nr:hypothetical protein [Nitrosopumilus sp.]MDH3823195.1 hypothetical protein [Nitrosopumilus sp.]MDH3834707.1 hypothetical protein [Nitrosopumilus sp.]